MFVATYGCNFRALQSPIEFIIKNCTQSVTQSVLFVLRKQSLIFILPYDRLQLAVLDNMRVHFYILEHWATNYTAIFNNIDLLITWGQGEWCVVVLRKVGRGAGGEEDFFQDISRSDLFHALTPTQIINDCSLVMYLEYSLYSGYKISKKCRILDSFLK